MISRVLDQVGLATTAFTTRSTSFWPSVTSAGGPSPVASGGSWMECGSMNDTLGRAPLRARFSKPSTGSSNEADREVSRQRVVGRQVRAGVVAHDARGDRGAAPVGVALREAVHLAAVDRLEHRFITVRRVRGER